MLFKLIVSLLLVVELCRACNDGYTGVRCNKCKEGYIRYNCSYPFVEGCPWDEYTQYIDWDFLSTDNIDIDECNELCKQTAGCHKFEFYENKYCSSWLLNACTASIEVSSGVSHQVQFAQRKYCDSGNTFQCIRGYLQAAP